MALAVGGAVILQGGWQRALVAVLVVELVVPLEDRLTGPQHLRGGLGGGGGVEQGRGLAQLSGQVAAGVGRAQRAVACSAGSLRYARGGLEAGLLVGLVERGA